ncbi:MAG: hypothetical protein RLZZ299_2550 [Pseudomonadota bacterium]|jgi:hypothetical protein
MTPADVRLLLDALAFLTDPSRGGGGHPLRNASPDAPDDAADDLELDAPDDPADAMALASLAACLAAHARPPGRILRFDGELLRLDGTALHLPRRAHLGLLQAVGWLAALDADTLHVVDPADPDVLRAGVTHLREARRAGQAADLPPDATCLRVGRSRPRPGEPDPDALEQDVPPRRALTHGLEELAAHLASLAGEDWPAEVGLRRTLARLQRAVAAEETFALGVALRADADGSLPRHLARAAVLHLACAHALGLAPAATIDGAAFALGASLGLARLGASWWTLPPDTHAQALRARAAAPAPTRPAQAQWLRAAHAHQLAAIQGGDPADAPDLHALLFAASAWLDRARQGLHPGMPRCTPTQARAATGAWLRTLRGTPPGFPAAMEALLGTVPAGSVVLVAGRPGLLRAAGEVVLTGEDGTTAVTSATLVAAACSEPEDVPTGLYGARA